MELIGADFKTAKAEALPTGRASGGRVRTPKSERGGRVTGNRALPIRGAGQEPSLLGYSLLGAERGENVSTAGQTGAAA